MLLQSAFILTSEILLCLCHLQASKSELIKACSELGVPTEGSETDLINRLEEMLLYKDVYPKMFAKLQKTGGKDINIYSFFTSTCVTLFNGNVVITITDFDIASLCSVFLCFSFDFTCKYTV